MPASKPRSVAARLVEAEQRVDRRVVLAHRPPEARAWRARQDARARTAISSGRACSRRATATADEDPPPARRVAGPGRRSNGPLMPRLLRRRRVVAQLGEQIVDAARVRACARWRRRRVCGPAGTLSCARRAASSARAAAARSPSSVISTSLVARRPPAGRSRRRRARRGTRTRRRAGTRAARAGRRACRAAALRGASACDRPRGARVGGEPGADRRVADRQAADLRRRRDVGLHQRRRDAEHAGDVVEALRSSRRRAAASRRRSAGRADRGRRWRTRSRFSRCSTRRARIGRRGRRAIDRGLDRARPGRRASRGPGRGAPAGGIMPVRSLRTTFSHTCGVRARPARRRARRATRPPVFSRGRCGR